MEFSELGAHEDATKPELMQSISVCCNYEEKEKSWKDRKEKKGDSFACNHIGLNPISEQVEEEGQQATAIKPIKPTLKCLMFSF